MRPPSNTRSTWCALGARLVLPLLPKVNGVPAPLQIMQSRGGVTTLGRVALPGGFAVLATLMLLAGVFEASFLFEDTLIDVCDGTPCTADHRE